MCCSGDKKAKREARALRARLARDEAMLHSYRAQESAMQHTYRVHEGIALKMQKAHEAAALQVQRAEQDVESLKRDIEAQNALEVQRKQAPRAATTAQNPMSGTMENSPPSYNEIVHSDPHPVTQQSLPEFGSRGHSDSSDDDRKMGSPTTSSFVPIATLPSDHPVHSLSTRKVERLRRRGVDPVMKAEMDEMTRLRSRPGFWSRLR